MPLITLSDLEPGKTYFCHESCSGRPYPRPVVFNRTLDADKPGHESFVFNDAFGLNGQTYIFACELSETITTDGII